jgi:hypothetical protein
MYRKREREEKSTSMTIKEENNRSVNNSRIYYINPKKELILINLHVSV